jgi:hypothetical protein
MTRRHGCLKDECIRERDWLTRSVVRHETKGRRPNRLIETPFGPAR